MEFSDFSNGDGRLFRPRLFSFSSSIIHPHIGCMAENYRRDDARSHRSEGRRSPAKHRTIAVVLGLFCIILAALGYSCFKWHQASRTKSERESSIGVVKLKPGPWGDISCVPIIISPPLEFIPESMPATSSQVLWRFPEMTRETMAQYLTERDISEGLHAKLLNEAKPDPASKGMVVQASKELVLGLSPEDRAKLYLGLTQFIENPDHVKAFRFCGKSLDEWFEHTKLRSETKRLVEPLIYRIGRFMFFADLRTIESDIATSEERRLLLKALSQERTFLVQLNVPANSDIESLVRYWGRRGQAKDIRPILESLAGIQSDAEGEDISIVHLLPPFSRRRIFTYPVPAERLPAINRDCHWTALNFFAETPDDALCDAQTVAKTIVNDYHRIYGDLRVGDVAMFFNGPDTYIHSAVYIADDVFFTKNGSLSTRPWMFMRLDDLKEYYPTLKPLEVRYYRKNDT